MIARAHQSSLQADVDALVEFDAVIVMLCALVDRQAFPDGSFDLASSEFFDRDRLAGVALEVVFGRDGVEAVLVSAA